MDLQFVGILGFGLFAATIVIFVLHVSEWLQITTLVRLRADDRYAIKSVSSKSVSLKRELEVEMLYYSFMLGFLLLFVPNSITLSAFVLLFAVLHFVQFHALKHTVGEKLLAELTERRVAAIFAVDAAEFVLLLFLAIRLYSLAISIM